MPQSASSVSGWVNSKTIGMYGFSFAKTSMLRIEREPSRTASSDAMRFHANLPSLKIKAGDLATVLDAQPGENTISVQIRHHDGQFSTFNIQSASKNIAQRLRTSAVQYCWVPLMIAG